MAPQRTITTIAVKCGLVYLNDRVEPDTPVTWTIPTGTVFLMTDLVAQNRGPGDVPVAVTQFTRFSIPSPLGTDAYFHIVGNETLNVHLETGIQLPGTFRFYNVVNSSAPFVEFHITGRLQAAG
ncbi:MAG TPA: hypothetical protein VMU24_01065 [Candidatus Acidoferrales bacterium]|nr:hypothetical protein [Candidatus Acidoferrales bacterium]